MFYLMAFGNLLISIIISLLVMYFFSPSIFKILNVIIKDSISTAWGKYIQFSGVVVGISSGVSVHQLNNYIPEDGKKIITIIPEKIVLILYETIISTLQGLSWMFLIFFIFSLLAYIITMKPKKEK